MREQIVMFDGFEELDALAPLDVVASARRLGADVVLVPGGGITVAPGSGRQLAAIALGSVGRGPAPAEHTDAFRRALP